MNKNETQLATELDALLSARLQGKPAEAPSPELSDEVDLAEELLALAAQLEPDEGFLNDLEAQLAAATFRAQKTQPRPEPPFWLTLKSKFEEKLTMKRAFVALGAAIALLVIGYFAWTSRPVSQPPETEIVADAGAGQTPEPLPTLPPETEIVADAGAGQTPDLLPTLPALSGATGMSTGMGGDAEGSAMVPAFDLNPLAEAELILNANLPAETPDTPVYEAATSGIFSLDDVSRLAALFGLSGPVYVDSYYLSAEAENLSQPVYQVFDGSRQLGVSETHFAYFDNSGTVYVGSPAGPLPFAQSGPIAEAFLKERGLLDFPYVMLAPNGSDVEFRRLIDGKVAYYPELQVSVNTDGLVWAVSNIPLRELTALGNYPLRSAADAWQLVLDEGVDHQRVLMTTMPKTGIEFGPPPAGEAPPSWQRSYADGQAITLYPYPMVFMAVDGQAAPRIVLEGRLLTGPDEELRAIANYVGQQIVVSGTVRETDAGQVIELGEWRPAEPGFDYTFSNGTVRLADGQAFLIVSDTEQIALPDAPTDLSDGTPVYVSGWLEADPNGQPVFNWQSMGVLVEEEGQPEVIVPDGIAFEPIGQATINQVDLVYAFISTYDESSQTTRYVLSPAWRFSGETDTDELIEIYVQAVADELVAPPAQ